MTTAWQQISEACPRARWRKDAEADSCEQPGCSVRFGRFGMPGLSWSMSSASSSSIRTTSASNNGIDTTNSSPFSQTTTLSSVDSLSIKTSKTSIDSGSPIKGSPSDSISPSSILASSLFAPLRLFDSTVSALTAPGEDAITEDPSPFPTSITTGQAPPSTPTFVTSPRSSIFDFNTDGSNGNLGRNQSTSSTFSLPRSPVKLHRRHHCRRCGYCFCSDHSSHTATLILASEDVTLSTIDEMSKMVPQQVEELDDNSTLTTVSPSNHTTSSPPLASSSSHYIRARVCDTCYSTLQRAKGRLQDSSASPPQAPSLSINSGWSTPTIMEDDDEEEFFDSRERIRQEAKREQHEALKVLCNDYTANRVVAKAVDEGKASQQQQSCTTFIDCRQALQADFNLTMGSQLATSTLWEKVEVKRKTEELAKRALSIDSLVIDDHEDDWNVNVPAVVSLSKQSIFDRRSTSRPPSPQPIRAMTRRASTDSNNTISSILSTSPLSYTFTGTARMGASRLQRSFDSSQRSNNSKALYGTRRVAKTANK